MARRREIHDRPLPQEVKPDLRPPRGKPVPVLERQGFRGDIFELNDRVHHAVTSYERARGVRPSPSLVLDVVRSPVHTDQLAGLFDFPTKRVARAVGIAASALDTLTHELSFSERMEQAAAEGDLQGFLDDNTIDLEEEFRDPQAMRTLLRVRRQYGVDEAERELKAQGLDISYGGFGTELQKGLAGAGRTVGQMSTALVLGVPALVLHEGTAVYQSGQQKSPLPFLRAQDELARLVLNGVYKDFTNPEENPGYLFLDIFAGLSLGVGAGARVAAAGRAVGAKAKTRALAKRPMYAPIEYRVGQMVEYELASSNALVYFAQKWKAARANRVLAEQYPLETGFISIVRPLGMQAAIARLVSPQAKMGRLARRRREIEFKLEQIPRRQLEFAAGAAATTSHLHRKIQRNLRRGLSVGEQKYIQVIATDDPTPFQTWRTFHETMIDLDVNPTEHSAQLLALDLAEQIRAKGVKPGSRLAQTLPLVREIVAQRETLLADELGLLARGTAEKRVAAAGEIVRTATVVDEDAALARITGRSFYLPFLSRAKTRKQIRSEIRLQAGARPSEYGIPKPDITRIAPELKHVFTGKSILAGDFRIDATHLAGESYGRAVRLATVLNEHKRLLGAATVTKRSEFDIPIREVAGVPDELKAIVRDVEQGVLTQQQIDSLGAKPIDDLYKHLFPDEAGPIEGVKFVDSRLVLDVKGAVPEASGMWRGVQMTGQLVNEVFRVPMLFLRIAYAANLLSNAGMLWFQQGYWMMHNTGRALYSRHLYGDKVSLALDELVGGGRARSFVNLEMETKALAGGRAIAQMWHRLVDGWMRRSALIHEIQRRGFKGRKRFEEFLFNKEHRVELTAATREARKAMVDFESLAQVEKAYIRNWIFVYPWVSRSTVWSVRTLVEHPVKSDILLQLGDAELEDREDIIARAPEWFERTGYMPVGWSDDGDPVVINPVQLSAFGTVGELVPTALGLFAEDKPYAGLNDLLGPAASMLVMAMSGRDEYGNELPGPDLVGAIKEVAVTLPQIRAYERGGKKDVELAPLDLTNRRALIERQHKALEKVSLSPGWLNGWGMLITGGLTPREVETDALIARYWRDQPLEERHENEMRLIRQALNLQAKLLKRRLDPKVREAVDLAGDVDLRLRQLQKDHGRNPTQLDRDIALVDTLKENGKIGDQEAERLLGQARNLRLEKEHAQFRRNVNNRFAGGQALTDWDEKVRVVASFSRDVLQFKIDVLARRGISPRVDVSKVPQEALYQVGRDYLNFKEESDRRKHITKALTGADDTVAVYENLVWEDEQDVPVRVGDVRLPSFVRLEWAHKREHEKVEALASAAASRWEKLPALAKELLGKESPGMSTGWLWLEQAKRDFKEQNLGVSIQPGQIVGAAKLIEKKLPGFLKEFYFAQQAKVRRFELLKPYRDMPELDREKYGSVIASQAKTVVSALASGNYDNAALQETWRRYVRDTLRPWLNQDEQETLRRRLDLFGPTFVESLVNR
jgi:hypothetical protein